MKHYLDITLLPDAEANLGFLWQKIYGQLHIALADVKNADGNSDIAVSFPEYGSKAFPLGNKLRLLATTQEKLQKLDVPKWLNRLSDYCHWTSIKEVPEVNQYACFSRKQFKTNIERRARRRILKTKEPLEVAIADLKKKGFSDQESQLPFITLESSAKIENDNRKHKFRLFIERSILEKPEIGDINCYGLSKTATVPWFD